MDYNLVWHKNPDPPIHQFENHALTILCVSIALLFIRQLGPETQGIMVRLVEADEVGSEGLESVVCLFPFSENGGRLIYFVAQKALLASKAVIFTDTRDADFSDLFDSFFVT